MKEIVRSVVFFLTCLGVMYFGGVYLLSKANYNGKPAIYITNDYYVWKGGGTYSKFLEKDSFTAKDVIIVGSSRAYRHYNSYNFEKQGYTTWNLGSSAQSIENSYSIVKNIIIPATPKVILLDIARLGFEQSSIESSIDLITNTSNFDLKRDIVIRNKDVRMYNTLLSSSYNEEMGPLYIDKEYKGKGFSTKPDSLSIEDQSFLENITEEKKNKTLVRDFQVFKDILEICKNKNQKIVVVHSPISDFYSLEAQEDFVSNIKAMCKEYAVDFHDYQHVEGIHTINNYYDDSHLNASGVEIFNEALLNSVKIE